VDFIFLHVITYALSPAAAIDYPSFNALGDQTKMTGEWLAHCGACPVPEIANVFNRCGIDFHQITEPLTTTPWCQRDAPQPLRGDGPLLQRSAPTIALGLGRRAGKVSEKPWVVTHGSMVFAKGNSRVTPVTNFSTRDQIV